MPVIRLTTTVEAPITVVFDLSRSIDLHIESSARSQERAVAGRTTGLIELGETVTWEARHFGVKLRLTSKIVAYRRPAHFRDSMVTGPFRRFDHDHEFDSQGEVTTMRDTFDYSSPLGLLGRFADVLFLEGYLQRLLLHRNRVIKRIAESPESERFL